MFLPVLTPFLFNGSMIIWYCHFHFLLFYNLPLPFYWMTAVYSYYNIIIIFLLNNKEFCQTELPRPERSPRRQSSVLFIRESIPLCRISNSSVRRFLRLLFHSKCNFYRLSKQRPRVCHCISDFIFARLRRIDLSLYFYIFLQYRTGCDRR